MRMGNDDMRAGKRNQGDPLEHVERGDLLLLRFSDAEIRGLSRLQVRHRQCPNALDLPVEERRLLFARWLVEHGWLHEGVGTELESQPLARALADQQPRLGATPTPDRGAITPGAPSDAALAADAAQRTQREHWRLVALRAWSGVRRGLAKLAEIGRELEYNDYLSCQGRYWGLYGMDDLYWLRNRRNDARSYYDELFWLRGFRHDG